MGTPWYFIARAALKSRGVRYIDVAEACGVTESAVGHWLNGRRFPNVEEARKIARLAGLSLDDMFGQDPDVLVLTRKESEIIDKLRRLPAHKLDVISQLLDSLSSDD